ncbi:MAG: hypothetical protein Ct9H90mP21_1980 [Methanobacteriota archaeon]|nr:MAG: hypothetical protein Ct9H90mP21_1980 [Euryarchaeota archaeon]
MYERRKECDLLLVLFRRGSAGIVIRDSIDLQLISTTIEGALSEPSLDIDNTGNLFPGIVILDDIAINSPSSNYSVGWREWMPRSADST